MQPEIVKIDKDVYIPRWFIHNNYTMAIKFNGQSKNELSKWIDINLENPS